MAESDQQTSPADKKTAKGCGTFVFILILAVVGVIIAVSSSGSSTSGGGSGNQVVRLPSGATVGFSEFNVQCRNLIRAQLTRPDTANFLGPLASSFAQARAEMANENIWTQRFEVEAQNAFGAKLRTRWRCMLDGYDGRYSLEQSP